MTSIATPTRLIPVVLLACVLLALALRLHRLDDVPVFYDEDRFAYVAYEMSTMSWTQALGRPMDYLETGIARAPMVLVTQALLTVFVQDSVLAGRMLALSGAAITTTLCYWVGRRLGGPAVGLVTSFLYAVAPMALLHEQMGLQDGPLTAGTAATVLAALIAIERISWRWAVAALLLGALTVQLKVPALALAALPPFLVLLHPEKMPRIGPALLAALGPALSYAMLALGPLGASMAEEERRLRIIQPLASIPANIANGWDLFITYFPPGILVLLVLGRIVAGRWAAREAVAYSLVVIAFIIPWLVLSRWLPSRYYLPALPFLCAFVAVGCVAVPRWGLARHRIAGVGLALVCAGLMAQFAWSGFQFVDQLRSAPLSTLDINQYRSGWPSGYGHLDAARYVRTISEPNAVVAYVVDPGHRMGAGVHAPLPSNLSSLGRLELESGQLRPDGRPLYVMVDDSSEPPLARTRAFQQRYPALQQTARFENPGSSVGVTILKWTGGAS